MRPLPRVDPNRPTGPAYRAYAWLSATRPMGWVSQRLGWRLDPIIMRWSGGRVGLGLVLPTALLVTRGARTSLERSNVVIYFNDGDSVVIVASKMGLPEHPAWFHNLVAHPDVTLGGREFRASVVDGSVERDRIWGLADRVFPPYRTYRRRSGAAGREIPLVRLTPV